MRLTKEREEIIRNINANTACGEISPLQVRDDLIAEIDALRDENLNLSFLLEGEKKDSILWKHNFEEACLSRDKHQADANRTKGKS